MKKIISILLIVLVGVSYFHYFSTKNVPKSYDYQGVYSFDEKSDQIDGLPLMNYRLSIDSNTGKWNGNLILSDGQKNVEINVIPQPSTTDNSVNIRFESYLNGTLGEFEKDDVLFTIEGTDKGFFVTWGTLKPVSKRYLNGVIFKKI